MTIPWTQFFTLRSSKKTWERVGGVVGGVSGLFSGSYYFFFVKEFDPTTPLFGLPDPTPVYILGALSCAGIASTVGIFGVGSLWRFSKSLHILQALDSREKEFFTRLSKYRPKDVKFLAVPGSGEVALPDYYGERINSVKDYRHWIRKQKKFIARNLRPNLTK